MNADVKVVERVIGFDSHPDTFTAALLRGPTPAAAIVEKVFDKVALGRLSGWAQKHTTPQDLFVLEASGNSFHVVRALAAIGRRALVLESCHLGKLKETHASNDKISAVRIGKAYLAGTAKEVWVPDPKTQERRDLFLAYGKASKRTTQLRNRIKSYLSDQGVRLPRGTTLAKGAPAEQAMVLQARAWSPVQRQLIEGLMLELRQAEEQRRHWRSLMAQEVLADPQLLSLTRLCGIRETIAFALGAIIGDIHRFAGPKKLVKYIGLNPAFDDSGQEKWSGGIGGHGRKDLRSLLIEAAHAVWRSGHPLARWGRMLLARKSSLKLAVAARARKLAVAIWYLMMGRWTSLEEIDTSLSLKVGRMISRVGADGLSKLGKTRKSVREQIFQSLKTGKAYALDPDKKFVPKDRPGATLAQEYGLA
jgi:transposase